MTVTAPPPHLRAAAEQGHASGLPDTATITICGLQAIHPNQVGDVWPEAEPALRADCARLGAYTMSDLLRMLVGGRAQLWRVYDAWAVTAVVPFMRKRIARLELLGGALPALHTSEMLAAFEMWARAYHADELCITKRPGLDHLPSDWCRATVWMHPVRYNAPLPVSDERATIN